READGWLADQVARRFVVRRISAALVLLAVVTGLARASLNEELDTPILHPLSRAYSSSIARSLPVPAASAGVTFTFNPATSAFEPATEIAGQVYLERAKPIGTGRLDLSVTYQWIHVDTFDGHDLDDLSDTQSRLLVPAPHNSQHQATIPHLSLSLVTHEVTTSITYGVTPDLEVNLTIPV